MHMLINVLIRIIMFRPSYYRKIIKELTLLKINIVAKEFDIKVDKRTKEKRIITPERIASFSIPNAIYHCWIL